MVQYSGSQVHLDMLKVDFHMTSKKNEVRTPSSFHEFGVVIFKN